MCLFYAPSSIQTAVDVLLEDGFLIPTGKQLLTLKIEPGSLPLCEYSSLPCLIVVVEYYVK